MAGLELLFALIMAMPLLVAPAASVLATEPAVGVGVRPRSTGPAPKMSRPERQPAELAPLVTGICSNPPNPIVAENCLPGDSSYDWQVTGAGDASIQGFATDISFNLGDTVSFKVNDTAGAPYHIDIYRMGYYGGNGARLITTIPSTQTAAAAQPNCTSDPTTGLVDCGNWSVTATWTIPTGPGSSPSGIYIATPVREDTGGESQIVFVVRDDASTSDVLFETSDTTWQAYNDFGGNSLYYGAPGTNPGRAYKVSFNRPFNNRNNASQYSTHDFVLWAEYPMVRWLEANGYNVRYASSLDADRSGVMILNHRAWLSVGHDEYWSGGERANITSARNAGVHLGFFSGNTGFWKVRWESSTVTTDGTPIANRTMTCYKETFTTNGLPIDPADPATATATWRDPRFGAPADGYQPENALNGTIFTVNDNETSGFSYTVPQADGLMRFWRGTSIASLGVGKSATLPKYTLGYEYDTDVDNNFRPPGVVHLSTTTLKATSSSSVPVLEDSGGTYINGTVIHNMTLYKATSGALVFSAGSVQWSWGLDGNHDGGSSVVDARMKQATVNLFADMGIQPGSLTAGLLPATPSSDTVPPSSQITSPSPGASVPAGLPITISGTASDTGGGVVGGIDVSTDGGATWHPATGRGTWTARWVPVASGTTTILSRAVDDSGNIETPQAGVTVTVTGGGVTVWPTTALPGTQEQLDPQSLELGVRFTSDSAGLIKAIRFYAGQNNIGTHVVSLWSNSGKLLGRATLSKIGPAGWQQVNFATPVPIQANTVYVASYHTNVGYYASDDFYFAGRGVDTPPLHIPADGVGGANGLYVYASTPTFPSNTYNSENYWIDVVFATQ